MTSKHSDITPEDLRYFVQQMIRLGRCHAVREGVPLAELEDCEVTFVERMLQHRFAQARFQRAGRIETWLHRCAQNHARNYRRHVLRREGRCVSLSAPRNQATRELSHDETPELLLMQKHDQASVDRVVARLLPEVRSMLFRHYLMGQTAAEIATNAGRSAHAVEQALYRARQTVRSELSRAGLNSREAPVASNQ